MSSAEEWDHDHCVGCWATFSELDHPDSQHDGYMTSFPDTESPEPTFDWDEVYQEANTKWVRPTLGMP